MTKKEKLISILPYLLVALFFVSYVAMILPAYSELMDPFIDFDFIPFMIINGLSMVLVMILTYVIFTIFIIIHELGHLVFGIKAGLIFDSFSFLWFVIQKKDNKIKLIMKPMISGVGGYCSLKTESNKHYDLNKTKLLYLGGVIFNFASALILGLFLLFTKNIYIESLLWISIITNVYFALNNVIPAQKSGLEVDISHVMYCNSDMHYMETLCIQQSAIDLLNEGKNLDSLQLKMPSSFDAISDVMIGDLYIENLLIHNRYEEATHIINNMLTNAQSLLNRRLTCSLKIQKLNCLFNTNASVEELKKVWDKDLSQYISTMSAFSPSLIAYNYLNAAIIEKNDKKAKKYKKQFAKINKDNYPKHEIYAAESMLKKLEEYLSTKP